MIRQLIILSIAIALFGCSTNENEQSSRKPDGTYRPSGFHAFINHGTNNKPISLLKIDSLYHLFYSTNSNEWGHLSSDDMLSWKPELSFPFSSFNEGEVIWDGNNLTGLNAPWNVLFINDNELNLSYSNNGTDWTAFQGNPILEVEGVPSITWSSDLENWVLSITNEKSLSFYTSSNLTTWKNISNASIENEFKKASLLSHEGQWFLLSQQDVLSYQFVDFSGEEIQIIGQPEIFKGMETGTYSIINNEENLTFLSANKSTKAELPTFSTPLNLSLNKSKLSLSPALTFKSQIVGKRRTKLSKLVTDGPSWFNFTVDQGFKEIEIVISDSGSELIFVWNKEDQSISIAGSALATQDVLQKNINQISDQNFSVDILIDHASIDLFLNGGEYATSLLTQPQTFFSNVSVKLDGEVYDAKGILYDIGT